MSLKNKIQIIDRKKIVDERGWFLKVINGKEDFLPEFTGEVYLISANVDECRANHFHIKAHEWFTLIKGKAMMIIEDINTKERITIELNGDVPQTVYIPSKIAHAFKNIDKKPYILVTYTNKHYDPNDTVEYNL